ncbi:MAG: PQQ-binding-like beta-propeller repeat protein [Gemmataceae bacterium]
MIRWYAAGLMALMFLFLPTGLVKGDGKGTWPQWRGPNRDSKVQGTNWPKDLKRLKQTWRVELGKSYSGPIVTEDRVFTTETRDRKLEVVYAFDRKTGKKIWETSWKGSLTVPFFAASNGSWIRSTPAYDGKNLYVAGMRDVLVCLRGKDGKEVWRFDFVKEFQATPPAFGFVCSPLLDQKHVYVQAGGAFVKLDKNTGKVLWKTLAEGRKGMDSAFSSPIFAKLKGRKQLVVQTRQKLAGVDSDTGKVLWSEEVPAFRGMNILTPTIYKDGLFTSTYRGGAFFFNIDKSPQNAFSVAKRWSTRTEAYMSSPIIIDGHAYVHLRNQTFACIDLEDGAVKWSSSQRFGRYWSMVAQGKKILALDQKGVLYLIEANPQKFQILDRKEVSRASTWAHLAIAGNQIFVRELQALSAYSWK